MINDHVDLLVEFAIRHVDINGMEMCVSSFRNIHMRVRELPLWIEFRVGGALIGVEGMEDIRTTISFPLHETGLFLVMGELIQKAMERN